MKLARLLYFILLVLFLCAGSFYACGDDTTPQQDGPATQPDLPPSVLDGLTSG
jgi:hypothetical protein